MQRLERAGGRKPLRLPRRAQSKGPRCAEACPTLRLAARAVWTAASCPAGSPVPSRRIITPSYLDYPTLSHLTYRLSLVIASHRALRHSLNRHFHTLPGDFLDGDAAPGV